MLLNPLDVVEMCKYVVIATAHMCIFNLFIPLPPHNSSSRTASITTTLPNIPGHLEPGSSSPRKVRSTQYYLSLIHI